MLVSQFPLPVAMLDENMDCLLVSGELLSACDLVNF